MTMLAARLIVPLARYAAAIAGSADKQSVKFVESTWRSWLSRAHVEPAVTDRVFRAIGTDAVTRPQIRRLAEDAETADLRLALLIAALVWGRGKKNGRMRDSIIKTLTHDDRDRVLERTAELAQDDNIPAAYRAWTLPGLRQPFFTKWLWAATSLAPEKCCLVHAEYGGASKPCAGAASKRRGIGATGTCAMPLTSKTCIFAPTS